MCCFRPLSDLKVFFPQWGHAIVQPLDMIIVVACCQWVIVGGIRSKSFLFGRKDEPGWLTLNDASVEPDLPSRLILRAREQD